MRAVRHACDVTVTGGIGIVERRLDDAGGAARHRRVAGGPNQRAARDVWPVAWGALLAATLMVVGRDALPDDGLISLAYARNVAEHMCWCLTPGVGAHTATSPLNVTLLAIGIVLVETPMMSVLLLLAACLATTAMWLRNLGGDRAALVGPTLLATAPVLTGALGLETYLAVALLVGLVRYGRDGRWAAVGVGAGLAVLTRPDMAVSAAVVVAVLATTGSWWPRVPHAATVAVLVTVPWFVLAWWRLGSVWPDTVAVKSYQPGWVDGTVHLHNGLGLYLASWPAATTVTVLTLMVGLMALAVAVDRRMWPAVALGLGGLANTILMAATAGPPAAYYLGPGVAGLGLGALLVTRRAPWMLPAIGAVVVAAVAVTAARGAPWDGGVAPIRQNVVSNAEYARIVDQLPTDAPIYASGEIGALAYYGADRGLTVVDRYLADPGRTDAYVARWRADHPWAEPNFTHYDPPPPVQVGYQLDVARNPDGTARWRLTSTG
jgi:hypothetical protein